MGALSASIDIWLHGLQGGNSLAKRSSITRRSHGNKHKQIPAKQTKGTGHKQVTDSCCKLRDYSRTGLLGTASVLTGTRVVQMSSAQSTTCRTCLRSDLLSMGGVRVVSAFPSLLPCRVRERTDHLMYLGYTDPIFDIATAITKQINMTSKLNDTQSWTNTILSKKFFINSIHIKKSLLTFSTEKSNKQLIMIFINISTVACRLLFEIECQGLQ